MFERSSRASGKPNMTYVELIKRAIERSPAKALSVSEIYASIESSHPFFRTSTKGWKNTVRHLLSLTPCFVNNARLAPLSGKGGLWTIDPEASDTACRKRNRASPIDRPLTTTALADRPLSNVKVGQTSLSSSLKLRHATTSLSHPDESYSASCAVIPAHSKQTELELETVSSVSLLSPSSSSSGHGFSPQTPSSTSDSTSSSFTLEASNPIGSHQKHTQLTTGICSPEMSNPVHMFTASKVPSVRNAHPDRYLMTTSTSLGNRYSRPSLPPQLSSASYPLNTTCLTSLNWPSAGRSLNIHDHNYPTYSSAPAPELKQNTPLVVSTFDPVGHSSGRDLTSRTNYPSLDKQITPTEPRSIRVSSTSSLSLALHTPPLPSPSYSQDGFEHRRDDDPSTYLGPNSNDHNRRCGFDAQDRRFTNEQNEERKLHSLSFRSMPFPGPSQHPFHLPSPSPSSSLNNSFQRSPYTSSPAFDTPSTGPMHPPHYQQHHHPAPQLHGGLYATPMNQHVRQDEIDWW
ncbi:forkhead box protein j3 [Phaffia rhodozyma]|uniref:Forkhead box protein j3 n=1 Tax=Phaffia rhodozyma TaxID=264483 RepID=A0A0F7SQ30_PHARH|nr:forkhead box protein j3 [Phaffia rhodozyma]